MKLITTFAVLAAAAVLMFLADTSPEPSESLLGFQVVSEAQAVAGTRRRAHRRGVAVGAAAATAAGAASSQQQSGTEQQQSQ